MTGAWLAQCLSRLHAPGRSGADGPTDHADDLGYFAALAVSAAVQAGTFAEVDVKVPGRRLLLPGTGYLELDSGRETTAASAAFQVVSGTSRRRSRLSARPERVSRHDPTAGGPTHRRRDRQQSAGSPDRRARSLPRHRFDQSARRHGRRRAPPWCNTFAEAWKLLSDYHPAKQPLSASACPVWSRCVLNGHAATVRNRRGHFRGYQPRAPRRRHRARGAARPRVSAHEAIRPAPRHSAYDVGPWRIDSGSVAARSPTRGRSAAGRICAPSAHRILVPADGSRLVVRPGPDGRVPVGTRGRPAGFGRRVPVGSLTRAGAWFVAEMRGIVERWRKVPVVTTANLPRSFA